MYRHCSIQFEESDVFLVHPFESADRTLFSVHVGVVVAVILDPAALRSLHAALGAAIETHLTPSASSQAA